MKRLATLALAVVLLDCREERPLSPESSLHLLSASANLSGPSTANATVTQLAGLPGYRDASALAINASGHVVGFVGGGLAVSFDPPTVLYQSDAYPFDNAQIAYGINDAGVISGEGSRDFGRKTFAGPLPGGWLPPLTDAGQQFGGYINNAGEVVANTFFDPLNRTPGHATIWIPGVAGYAVVDLGTLNDNTISPVAITPNRSGSNRIIVGSRERELGGPPVPVVWQNGGWSDLPPRAACGGDNTGKANDVSDDGLIVGSSCGAAVVWKNGIVHDLHADCQTLFPPGAGGPTEARGIAVTSSVPSRILIVGLCWGPTVWYDDGAGGYGAEALPLLEGDTEGMAHDVNSAGQIVGYTRKSVFSSDPTAHAVLWTYTPPPLTPNQAPTASTGGPYGGNEGASVAFDGTGSSDPDGHPLAYDWDFGDGSEHGSGAAPSHTYADNGTYTITLTVDDGHGGSDVATTAATIGNVAPQVNAGTASSVQSGQTLNFSGDVSDAGAADTPSSWTLDWGDATTPLSGNSAIPGSVSATHTYYGTGTFTLQLTVTDKDGGVGTGSRTVTVDPRSVTIAASPDAVSLSEQRAKRIDIIIFSASGLDATQIDPATLSVGDGNDPDALPVQRKNGAYVLSLRDVNRDGLRDLTFGVEKLDPDLGLAAPSTTLVVRGAIPTSFGPIVLRGSVAVAVSP